MGCCSTSNRNLGQNGQRELGVGQHDVENARGSVSPTRERLVTQCDQGPQLKFPITFKEAEVLRLHYTRHGSSKPLHEKFATNLIQEFTSKYAEMHVSSVTEIDMPKDGRLIMVGDTHGQLQDVLHIFHTNGPPTSSNVYLINGDIADRGPNACEIFFMVFAYFLADPRSILMNRGNHESEDIDKFMVAFLTSFCRAYGKTCRKEMNALEAECGGGFRDEVFRKFDSRMYWRFVAMMKVLQLCTVVGKEVFVVHGGLSEVDPCTLDLLLMHDAFNIDRIQGSQRYRVEAWDFDTDRQAYVHGRRRLHRSHDTQTNQWQRLEGVAKNPSPLGA